MGWNVVDHVPVLKASNTLLRFQWPKQVTWLFPTFKGRGEVRSYNFARIFADIMTATLPLQSPE